MTDTSKFFSTLGLFDISAPTDPNQRLRLYDAGLAFVNDGEFQPTDRGVQFLLCLGDDEYEQVMTVAHQGDYEQVDKLLEPCIQNLLEAFDAANTNNIFQILLGLLDMWETMQQQENNPFTESDGND